MRTNFAKVELDGVAKMTGCLLDYVKIVFETDVYCVRCSDIIKARVCSDEIVLQCEHGFVPSPDSMECAELICSENQYVGAKNSCDDCLTGNFFCDGMTIFDCEVDMS